MNGADEPHRALWVEVVELPLTLGAALPASHIAQAVVGPHVRLVDLSRARGVAQSRKVGGGGKEPALLLRGPLGA